jgi:hypothetical protein
MGFLGIFGFPGPTKARTTTTQPHACHRARDGLSDLTATVKALTSATQKQAGVRPLLGFFSLSFVVVLDRADEEATSWAAGTEQLITGGKATEMSPRWGNSTMTRQGLTCCFFQHIQNGESFGKEDHVVCLKLFRFMQSFD